ncbi:DNA-binding protein WhiA [Actinocorallia longicatena]|uniref:DNA-binding protein WhiA n=1 Tax=Actinocorallia longicatena TaxID=111803 RepID=A0ABP6QJ17_9ACTN
MTQSEMGEQWSEAAAREIADSLHARVSCRHGSVLAGFLRCSGQLTQGAIEVTVNGAAAWRSLRCLLAAAPVRAGDPVEVTMAEGRLRDRTRRRAHWADPGHRLSMWAGLIEGGRPVQGLARRLVIGPPCCALAAVTGAALAVASWSAPSARRAATTLACPSAATSLGLRGLARRAGLATQIGEAEPLRLAVADDDITRFWSMVGAPRTAQRWQRTRDLTWPDPEGTRRRPSSVNGDRSVAAATAQTAQVREVMEKYADVLPEVLAAAGWLRLDFPTSSLEELGRAANPQLSKDTVYGRLRRLCAWSPAEEI